MSVFALSGCGGTTRLFSKPIADSTYITYQEWGPNRDIAVMPFANFSKDKDAGQKVRELFITELYVSGAFKDIVDEGEMLEVMKKLKVRETDSFGKETIKTLGDNLGVQAIIFGTVEEFTERAGSGKGAVFAVSLRMVDVETGQILWLGNASKEGGGTVSEALGLSDGPNVIDVSRSVCSKLIGDLAGEVRHHKVKGKKADELARKKELQQNATAPKVNDKTAAAPAAEQQAGANPPPAVKGSSAGIVPTPMLP
ncbi:MAG: CsgG/HfaB family protein [Nitrospirota bacterium]